MDGINLPHGHLKTLAAPRKLETCANNNKNFVSIW